MMELSYVFVFNVVSAISTDNPYHFPPLPLPQLFELRAVNEQLQKYRANEQAVRKELFECQAERERYRKSSNEYYAELREFRRREQLFSESPYGHQMEQKHKEEMRNAEDRHRKEVGALTAQLNAELYMEDGEKWSDFFKRKYYGHLVLDDETGLPVTCPHTGEVIPKSAVYERERDVVLAELEDLRKRMPSDEVSALLERVRRKARVFKRKYRFLKTVVHEHLYVKEEDDLVNDAFCETDDPKVHDEDSDDEIRVVYPSSSSSKRAGPGVVQDIAVPLGFTVRPADEDD